MNNFNNFERFIDNPSTYQFKTCNIGDIRKNPEDPTLSTFNNVIDYVENVNLDLGKDLIYSHKNINHLIKLLTDINDTGKVELSTITKELSNKIMYIYDNICTSINEQRCENLKLQLEIANLTKDKNALRHEVKNLTEAVRMLEVSLGVFPDPIFETMMINAKTTQNY